MTPVYFPYTYMPDSLQAAALMLFDNIIVYRPSSSAPPEKDSDPSHRGQVEERLPLIKYEGMIEKAFNDYLSWAEFHQPDQLRNLKSQLDTIPFFDDSSSFKIKSEITTSPDGTRDKPFDPDFKAGLFLMYAEYLDARQAEINRDLHSINIKTNDMLRELRGEDSLFSSKDIVDDPTDPFCYMIKERLRAWSTLAIQDFPGSCLFLTVSPEVISVLSDGMEGIEKILDYPDIPLNKDRNNILGKWQKEFNSYLLSMAMESGQTARHDSPPSPIPGKGNDGFSFVLYSVNGITPVDFFSRFSRQSSGSPDKKDNSSNYTNTLIGVIQ